MELYQAIVDIYIYFLGFVPGTEDKTDGDSEEEAEEEKTAGRSRYPAACLLPPALTTP